MGGLGSLSTVAGRFTDQEQVTKLEVFINNNRVALGNSTVDTLNKAIVTATTNMDWDKQYISSITNHLNKLKNSAPIKSISAFITIITLSVLYIFN